MDPGRERRELARGAHIVVGTPGRLRDHLERRALKVSALKAAVLDEADEMLDMGFREDLQFILETTPEDRRTLLFSATLPKAIVTLATHYQKDALRIATRSDTRRPCRHRISRHPHRRQQDRARRGQSAALHGPARRAGVLQHPQCGAPHGSATAPSAAFPAWRCRASCRRASATMRCRRCATAAPGSASPPMSRRAASTCPASAWSSMPNCPTTPRCCSIAAAAPAAPARRASASCWCRRRAAAAPRRCWAAPGSTRCGAIRLRRTTSARWIRNGCCRIRCWSNRAAKTIWRWPMNC